MDPSIWSIDSPSKAVEITGSQSATNAAIQLRPDRTHALAGPIRSLLLAYRPRSNGRCALEPALEATRFVAWLSPDGAASIVRKLRPDEISRV